MNAPVIGHIETPHRGLITVSIMAATVMQVLDTTIANVALPDMTGDLGASRDTVTWVLTSYIVAAAIMTPMTGWIAGQLGRKQAFLVSIVGFTATSMACGLAWNLDMMVFFRLLQGMFGAAIVPLSQTFLLDINPKERHGSAMAMWGAGIMVGPIIGPTLGGWLTDAVNWRWVFFINLPVGIVAFLGCAAYLPVIAKRLRGFDFFGFAMLSLGVGALQLLLDRGGEVDWFSAPEIWIEMALSLSGFWVFTVHLMTSKNPFIDPHVFRDRNFVTGLVFIFVDRRHPARLHVAAAADAHQSVRLSHHDRRPGAGAARGGDHDLDDRGGPPHPLRRCPPHGHPRPGAGGPVALPDDRLFAADGFEHHHLERRGSGPRAGTWSSCRCPPSPSPPWTCTCAPMPRVSSA